jgi:GST-like protein
MEHITLRRNLYIEVFEQLVREEHVLAGLYAPLKERLVGAKGALKKLAFVTERTVDLERRCENGERQFDLRSGDRVRGRGGIYSIADIACVPWVKMFGLRYPNEVPYPHMEAWVDRVFARPAVQRGVRVDLDKIRPVVVGAVPVTDDVRRHLFASYQAGDGSTR